MGMLSPEADLAHPRRLWRRILLSVAVVLAALFAFGFWRARSFTAGPMPPALGLVRAIPVLLPDRRPALLGDRIRPGVPTVISLWASWCGPCRLEAPTIVALRRQFGPDKLNLVYLNVREDSARANDLAHYLQSIGMPPNDYLAMEIQYLGRLTNDARNLIPRTYVFDPAGAPTAMIVGYKPLALDRIAGVIDEYSRSK